MSNSVSFKALCQSSALGNSLVNLLLFFVLIFGLLVLLDYAFTFRDDPREPPRLRPTVPLVGHLIGIFRYGLARYCNQMSPRTNADMYTLGVFGLKIYVCNNRRIMPMIQRNAKTISLRPVLQTAAKQYAGKNSKNGDANYTRKMGDEFGDMQHASLAPGPHLDQLNSRMGLHFVAEVNKLCNSGQGSKKTKTISLYNWARDAVVQATSHAVYGPNHPLREAETRGALWEWQNYLPYEATGLGFLAPGGRLAREKIAAIYRAYNASHLDEASFIIKQRHRFLEDHGFSEDEIVSKDLTLGIAMFVNTVPTLYWVIYELFSRPAVLNHVRQEIESYAVGGSKTEGFTISAVALKTKCPTLLSVLQETQRTRHIHANTRAVTDDTLLDDGRYLLKAKNYLLIPGQPIHANPQAWGPSAAEFDAYRFVKKDKERAVAPSSFLSWGAPPHLCPGRQFAATEILLAVTLLVLRADLQPSVGTWEEKPALNQGEHVTLESPQNKIDFDLKAREEWDGEWTLDMGDSLVRVPIASG